MIYRYLSNDAVATQTEAFSFSNKFCNLSTYYSPKGYEAQHLCFVPLLTDAALFTYFLISPWFFPTIIILYDLLSKIWTSHDMEHLFSQLLLFSSSLHIHYIARKSITRIWIVKSWEYMNRFAVNLDLFLF